MINPLIWLSLLSLFLQRIILTPFFFSILLDSITLLELPFPGNMLYEEHMLKQMGMQEMCVFRMVCYSRGKEMVGQDMLAAYKCLNLDQFYSGMTCPW